MRNILFAITTGLVLSSAVHGTPVGVMDLELPSKDVLAQRLVNAGFEHFDGKTKLSSTLAGAKSLLGVMIKIEEAYVEYERKVRGDLVGLMMLNSVKELKPHLIKTVLQDYPQVFKEYQARMRELDH